MTPFNYQRKLRDHFKQETKTWDWFASAKIQQQAAEEFKNDLLKNSYRLTPESDVAIYEILNHCKQKLDIGIPITIYQSTNNSDNNAGISYMGNEAHIVLSGSVLKILNKDELKALIAHELGHVLFFQAEGGEFEITGRIITNIANEVNAKMAYYETARIFQLYMELFCDRVSAFVLENNDNVIEALVKLSTGLSNVSAQSYLKQADEILTKETASSGETHPELYIRAKALQLFKTSPSTAEAEIERWIEGNMTLESVDIFLQQKLTADTRFLLSLLTKPKWMRTETIHALCCRYFSGFNYDNSAILLPEKRKAFMDYSESIGRYFAYVLLDFIWADTSLEDAPLAFALEIAEHIGVATQLESAIKKEKKCTDRQWKEIVRKATATLSDIPESDKEYIFESL